MCKQPNNGHMTPLHFKQTLVVSVQFKNTASNKFSDSFGRLNSFQVQESSPEPRSRGHGMFSDHFWVTGEDYLRRSPELGRTKSPGFVPEPSCGFRLQISLQTIIIDWQEIEVDDRRAVSLQELRNLCSESYQI